MPVRTRNLYIGLKPVENRRAGAGERVVDVISLNAHGARVGVRVQWQLVRGWSYDWYLDNGQWRWRRTGRDIPSMAPRSISPRATAAHRQGGLREGACRLIVRDPRGSAESSQRFGVGRAARPGSRRARYGHRDGAGKSGAPRRARARANPRPYAGKRRSGGDRPRAETRTVRVGEGATNVDVPVSADWGSGATCSSR